MDEDSDPALGLKIILLVTVVLLVVGSVSPALLNNTSVDGIVLNNGTTTTTRVVKDIGAKTKLVKNGVPRGDVISGTFKPSIKSGYSYRWYRRSWINYCPGCKRYGTLTNNPKGVPERELTCSRCDADFCGVTGMDKGYGRRWSLRRA
jgi:N-acetylmuramoyl-L-alanine amidase